MNFDTGVADRLIGACRDAARALQDQRGGRESVSTAACAEFRGVFADCFRENVAAERAARSELVHMLDDVARQVQKAKSAAEVEQRRLSELTAWVLAAGWASAGSGVAVDVEPRPSTEETDRPSVNADTARQGLRAWASGSTAGASSADPATLDSAVSTFRIQDDTARGAADGVSAAASEFERECSWAHSDLDAVGSGLRRFLEDNQQDATRLSDIASMFRAAGGSGHVGQVTVSNDVLVLATVPASLSNAALLSYLSTATPADTKALATLTGWQQTLQRMDPSTIGAWWSGMNTGAGTAADVAGASQRQELLLAAAPAMFGALDGMPALARVRANQLNAPSLLRAAEKDLETALKLSGTGQARHDPNRTEMLQNAVAYLKQVHSWGLTNVTSSEVAGARYDKVISLAGAGMLPDWEPQPTTEYSNLYYYDVLIHGQGVTNPFTNRGVVWDGNNPIHRDEFDQNYYRGPDDDELDGAINSIEEGNILMDNHSLIATDSEDNMKALEKMLRTVTR